MKNIDEFDGANLALSGEELDLLQNLSFPLFISGLARSGKTTMLLFTFSSYAQ